MDIRVLIIANNEEACAIYRQAVEELGARCDTVSGLADLHQALVRTPYNGLMLDVATTIQARRGERARVQDLLEIFPTVRVRRDDSAGGVRALLYSTNRGISLEEFINDHCRAFVARGIRRSPRVGIHFNALLSTGKDFPEGDTEKTVTLDVARGGCFLFSTRNWEGIDTAWVRILELRDAAPIRVEICRRIPWGKSLAVPGIGVSFVELSPGQAEDILLMLDSRLSPLP